MSIRRLFVLAWMAAGLQVLSAAQTPTPQSPPAQSPGGDAARTAPAAPFSGLAGMQIEDSAEDASTDVPPIPAVLGGKGTSSAFLSELTRSNFLRGGVNVGAAYDDNPLLSGGGSNTSESIFPNISIEQTTSLARWSLGYAGGLTVNHLTANQKITNQNQGSHNLNFDSQFRLSPHVSLRVAENFSVTTGLFDSGNGTGVAGGAGGPNGSLITPLATQRSTLTTVEMNYHFALNDLVGASGSFYNLNFPDAGAQLTDSQTASGSAFWLHRFFRRDWGGVSYRFDRINGDGETRAHSFMVVNTLNLSNHITVTGFVGPQYSENQALVSNVLQPQSNNWSVAGGAEAGWQDQHTGLSAGYSRSVSDGGGLLGPVRLQNVHASFRRELIPGWAAALTVTHGTNQALTPSSTASSINLTSAGVSLERNVGKSVGFRLGYTHDFQEQLGAPGSSPTLDASRNRFFATLSYQWAKPLGM